jgi:hypothetical protein
MGWERHDLFIMENTKEKRTREVKNARLYRDKFGNLKNYFYEVEK